MSHLHDDFILPSTSWKLDESKDDSVVDGVNILARVQGPFFLVDGASRNGRYYSRDLWEKAIGSSKGIIENGQMLGTIGHETELDDTALMEGKVSHRVSKLWIDEENKIGMGEILVLNTSAGKELNAYLRGGVRFPVSSRATGEFLREKRDGAEVVDPSTYNLFGFDFVRNPGVEKAVPVLVESAEPQSKEPERDMAGEQVQTLLENLAAEKQSLQNDLDEALKSGKISSDKVIVLTAKVEESQQAITAITADKAKADEAIVQMGERLKAYEALGTPEEINQALDKAGAIVGELKGLGSVADIKEGLQKANEFFKANGSPVAITEALKQVSEYKKLATVPELNKLIKVLEKYAELGSPAELEKVLGVLEAQQAELKKKETLSAAEAFAAKHGIAKTVAESLLSTMDQAAATTVVESLRATRNMPSLKVGDQPAAAAVAEAAATVPVTQTRAGRMFEATLATPNK